METDWSVLRLVAEVRLATGGQIARRLWSATGPADPRARAARRALRRLEDWRVLDRQARSLGGIRAGSSSIVYGVGPVGHRLLTARGFRPRARYEYGQAFVAHTTAITELLVRLFEADRDGQLEFIGAETEPRCHRGFLTGFGARRILKPDVRVEIGAGAHLDAWWIEVDLATESAARIRSKLKAYLAYFETGEEQRTRQLFPRVVFLVPDAARRAQLESVIAGCTEAPQRLFSVWLSGEAVGRLAAEARV